MNRAMSLREFAERYGYSVQHLRWLCRRGGLPAFKVGGHWRIDQDAVEALIESKRPQTKAS